MERVLLKKNRSAVRRTCKFVVVFGFLYFARLIHDVFRERTSSSSQFGVATMSALANCTLAPLCELDAAKLKNTLYRSHPKFYKWMLQRKRIEERWSTYEYDKLSGSNTAHSDDVRCINGHCNVATGGAYLCPHVLQGIEHVIRTLKEPFCVVGSGSLSIEAWVLATSELDVVSFDLYNTEYQRRIAQTLFDSLGKARWTQVTGPFESNIRHVRCGAIFFDTNIRGDLNKAHWAKIESTLTINDPFMWIMQNNMKDFNEYCSAQRCGFERLGATKSKKGCFPDASVIPHNMHPAVVHGGDSWNEEYHFGKWKTFYFDDKGPIATACGPHCTYTYNSLIVQGKPVVRFDDYPFPDATPIAEQQERLGRVLQIFESAGVPYILGVSPGQLLLKGEIHAHIDFLNKNVKRGFVCMHGYDHRTTVGTDDVDLSSWEIGGEFAKYTASEFEELWFKGHEILRQVNKYSSEHFIPPFNSLNQMVVDVLVRHGVKYIHSFDVALRHRLEGATPHEAIGGNFGGYIEDYVLPPTAIFVVSEWGKTYAHVSTVNEYVIKTHSSSQIALHWFYDTLKADYVQAYTQFTTSLLSRGGKSVM